MLLLTEAQMEGGFAATGLAGLSFKASQSLKTTPFIENLKIQKVIDKSIFMFNLQNTNFDDTVQTATDGVVFGTDDINY